MRLAEQRQWGGLTERLMVATAGSYVVSPRPGAGGERSEPHDRPSLRELPDRVGRPHRPRGRRTGCVAPPRPTSIWRPSRWTPRFAVRSAADRAAFSSELTDAVTQLVARYHDAAAPGGRAHRLVVVAHPLAARTH